MTLMTRVSAIHPTHVADIVPAWAEVAPNRIALLDSGKTWTYAALNDAIRKTAAWLTEAGKVRPGDRVMLVCENGASAVSLYFACLSLGAWPVIANAKLADREVDEIREHSGARCIVLTVAASPRAKAHAQRLNATLADPAGYGSIAITAVNETTNPEPEFIDQAEDVAALIYTSGTTGKPKGVMLTHNNLLFVADATARARGLTPDDRVLATLPMSHILGLTGVLLGTLYAGATVYLTSRFDPAFVLGALKNDGLSVMIGAPSLYALLAEYAERKNLIPIPAPKLRLMSSAGAPLDAATKALAEKAFGQTLHNGYGITECGPTISLTALDAPRTDCAVGRILPGIETRLVGAENKDAHAGEAGELWVKSRGVMKGYYRAPEETAAAVTNGWFHTGDLARIEDGNLFIVGRAKEMIIRFGFNVYPAEVEGVLNAHPNVARSAVIGKSVNGTEEIFAFVQPAEGTALSEDAVKTFATSQLAPYKWPSRIVIVDALPMSPAGKILKSELAQRL
jgi:acyl-CoA synthetase (AMP-forming)/AMP-acid ligase II